MNKKVETPDEDEEDSSLLKNLSEEEKIAYEKSRMADPRPSTVERLVKEREEQLDKDIAEVQGLPHTYEDPNEELPEGDDVSGGDGDESPEGDQPPEPQTGDVFQGQDGQWYTRVKVDGVESDVPIAKLKGSYQKDAASSKRFEEAAAREAELAERERLIAAREAELTSRPPAPKEGSPSDREVTAAGFNKELVRQYNKAMFEGDEEAAEELMVKMLEERSGREAATPDDLADSVIQKLEQKEQARKEREFEAQRQAALQTFETDYADLAADPIQRAIWNQFTAVELAKKDGRSLVQIAVDAAELTKSYRTTPGGTSTNDDVGARRQQKKGLPTPVRRAGHVQQPPAEPRPQTRAEILEEARKARGARR